MGKENAKLLIVVFLNGRERDREGLPTVQIMGAEEVGRSSFCITSSKHFTRCS